MSRELLAAKNVGPLLDRINKYEGLVETGAYSFTPHSNHVDERTFEVFFAKKLLKGGSESDLITYENRNRALHAIANVMRRGWTGRSELGDILTSHKSERVEESIRQNTEIKLETALRDCACKIKKKGSPLAVLMHDLIIELVATTFAQGVLGAQVPLYDIIKLLQESMNAFTSARSTGIDERAQLCKDMQKIIAAALKSYETNVVRPERIEKTPIPEEKQAMVRPDENVIATKELRNRHSKRLTQHESLEKKSETDKASLSKLKTQCTALKKEVSGLKDTAKQRATDTAVLRSQVNVGMLIAIQVMLMSFLKQIGLIKNKRYEEPKDIDLAKTQITSRKTRLDAAREERIDVQRAAKLKSMYRDESVAKNYVNARFYLLKQSAMVLEKKLKSPHKLPESSPCDSLDQYHAALFDLAAQLKTDVGVFRQELKELRTHHKFRKNIMRTGLGQFDLLVLHLDELAQELYENIDNVSRRRQELAASRTDASYIASALSSPRVRSDSSSTSVSYVAEDKSGEPEQPKPKGSAALRAQSATSAELKAIDSSFEKHTTMFDSPFTKTAKPPAPPNVVVIHTLRPGRSQ